MLSDHSHWQSLGIFPLLPLLIGQYVCVCLCARLSIFPHKHTYSHLVNMLPLSERDLKFHPRFMMWYFINHFSFSISFFVSSFPRHFVFPSTLKFETCVFTRSIFCLYFFMSITNHHRFNLSSTQK